MSASDHDIAVLLKAVAVCRGALFIGVLKGEEERRASGAS
jgi:hypothetical protein